MTSNVLTRCSRARQLLEMLEHLKLKPSAVKEKATIRELSANCREVLEFVTMDHSSSFSGLSMIFAGSSEAEQRLETMKQIARLQIDQSFSDLDQEVEKILHSEKGVGKLHRQGSQAALARAALEPKLGAEEKTK